MTYTWLMISRICYIYMHVYMYMYICTSTVHVHQESFILFVFAIVISCWLTLQFLLKVEQFLVTDDGLVCVAKLEEETGHADERLGLVRGVVRSESGLQTFLQ